MISHWHGQKKSPAHIPIPVRIWKELGKEWEKDSNFIQICWRLLEKGRKDAGGRAGVVLAHYCLPEVSLSHTSSIEKRGELIRALLRINSNYCFDKTQKSPIIICLWKLLTALSFLKKKKEEIATKVFFCCWEYFHFEQVCTQENYSTQRAVLSPVHIFFLVKKTPNNQTAQKYPMKRRMYRRTNPLLSTKYLQPWFQNQQ